MTTKFEFNTTAKTMSGIEQIATSWLSDPPWQKVFKHTVDVVADYISYILVKLRFSEKAEKFDKITLIFLQDAW